MDHFSNKLKKLGACQDAIIWASTQKSAAAAWRNCKRGDWLLWLLGRTCTSERARKKLTLAACDCVATALKHVPAKEKRPAAAIRMARRWARGERGVSRIQVQVAADAAFAATYSFYFFRSSSAATNAAYAAAHAATLAARIPTAHADSVAAGHTTVAAAAAIHAFASAKKDEALLKFAKLVRRHFPKPPKIKEGE